MRSCSAWKFPGAPKPGNQRSSSKSHSLTIRIVFSPENSKRQVSRPLLRLMYGEYWFRLSRLSMMVIGSFASYTKTESVESAVWCLLTLGDGVEQVVVNRYLMYCRLLVTGNAGSKYLNRVQGQNYSFLFFEQQSKQN
jgi:hypothetical protein